MALSRPDDPVLVVCPKCGSRAAVTLKEATVTVTCGRCGYANATDPANSRRFDWHGVSPTDGYFGLPLWLQVPCCGESLWAFNRAHIELLASFVGAELRQRQPASGEHGGWRNSSIESRLPRWIKSRKNRDEILKAISFLRARLDADA